jgi:hypothetical protein
MNNPLAKAAGYFFPGALKACFHKQTGKNNRIMHRMIRVIHCFEGLPIMGSRAERVIP